MLIATRAFLFPGPVSRQSWEKVYVDMYSYTDVSITNILTHICILVFTQVSLYYICDFTLILPISVQYDNVPSVCLNFHLCNFLTTVRNLAPLFMVYYIFVQSYNGVVDISFRITNPCLYIK